MGSEQTAEHTLFALDSTVTPPFLLPGEQAGLLSKADIDVQLAEFRAELEALPTVHQDQLDLLPEHPEDQLTLVEPE